MNIAKKSLLLAFVGLMSACASQPPPMDLPPISIDGLQKVESQYFTAAYVRPEVDFGYYQELMIRESELAFRTPDRTQQQFPLTTDQKERFRDMLDASFAEELANSSALTLRESPGSRTLGLKVRVQDIVATVPPRSVSGVGDIALHALADVTLVIEISDSETAEILARVYDRQLIEGVAIAQKQGPPVTHWDEVDAVCDHWAVTVRDRLDAVVSESY